MNTCQHIQEISEDKKFQKANYLKFECEECVKTGDEWIHLRICQACGKMLCCNSSKNQHSQKHAVETEHPVISSAEMGENWVYCYIDDVTED